MTKAEKRLKKWILEEMPHEGSWKNEDNAKPYILAMEYLMENGQKSEEYVKEILHNMYKAALDEYG